MTSFFHRPLDINCNFIISPFLKFTFEMFFLLWIPITFLPTSNIIPMENIIAERYLYIPIIGFCIIFAVITQKTFGNAGVITVSDLFYCCKKNAKEYLGKILFVFIVKAVNRYRLINKHN